MTVARANPLLCYWAAYATAGGGGAPDRSVALSEPVRRCLEMAASGSMEGVFPRRLEDQAPLRWALERDRSVLQLRPV